MRLVSLILARTLPFMLTEIYIEALLIDPYLADQVWELWDARVITDDLAGWAWFLMQEGLGISFSSSSV